MHSGLSWSFSTFPFLEEVYPLIESVFVLGSEECECTFFTGPLPHSAHLIAHLLIELLFIKTVVLNGGC